MILWWQNEILPVSSNNTHQNFTIDKGTGIRQIAYSLKDKGLIRNPYAFILVTKILRIESVVQAGSFELSPNMDTFTIAKKLTKGTNDIKVTIPEGNRAEEVFDILASHLPVTSQDEWIPKLLESEGYLFPDTYNFSKDAGVDDVIKIMRDNFEKKYAAIVSISNLSKEEIVIIASLIEREVRHEKDRVLVASVIYNRLNLGMKLDIDATIQYALGYNPREKTWWKRELTADDLAINSAYNTYIHAGLPPTPIANPGIASIHAAANPADSNYFYYFTDKFGENHYATTLAEQNANIKRYGLYLID